MLRLKGSDENEGGEEDEETLQDKGAGENGEDMEEELKMYEVTHHKRQDPSQGRRNLFRTRRRPSRYDL